MVEQVKENVCYAVNKINLFYKIFVDKNFAKIAGKCNFNKD